MVGAAVNVTDVPEQIVLPGFAEMVTTGTGTAFTVIVILLLRSVAGLAQVALLVSTQVTTSLFARPVDV